MFAILNIPIGMLSILNVPWANWNSYLEGGGLHGEEIVKSTLFCKVHYVLNSDIKTKNIFFYFQGQSVMEKSLGSTVYTTGPSPLSFEVVKKN
jgi:hypothetical protein